MANRSVYLGLDQVSRKIQKAVESGDIIDMMINLIPLNARADSYLKRYKQVAPEGNPDYWRTVR